MSVTCNWFCWVDSSLDRASCRRALYFITPAASSNRKRRSSGLDSTIFLTRSCSMMAWSLAPTPASIIRSRISFKRQGILLIRYSLSPERYSLRVISISLYWPNSEGRPFTSLSLRVTSANPRGFRDSLPLKITSSILSPRRCLALCSPRTQRMASAMLLLPHPLGPTTAVTPCWNWTTVFSKKDLKPSISRDLSCIGLLAQERSECRKPGSKHPRIRQDFITLFQLVLYHMQGAL